MTNIKVLGSGCAKCIKTAEIIDKTAQVLDIRIELTKETSPETIMRYGVMSTPAIVIDEQLVHSGSIPTQADITQWLN